MAGYKPIPEYESVTVAKGARDARKLDRTLHMQVLELWATRSEVKSFDRLLDKFKVDARRARAKGKTIEIKDWHPRGQALTEQEKAWLQTRRTVTVMHFASYFL